MSLHFPILQNLRKDLTKNTISASAVNTVVGLATPCFARGIGPFPSWRRVFFYALRKSLLGAGCWNDVGMERK